MCVCPALLFGLVLVGCDTRQTSRKAICRLQEVQGGVDGQQIGAGREDGDEAGVGLWALYALDLPMQRREDGSS